MACTLLAICVGAGAAPTAEPVGDPLRDCRALNDRGRAAEASTCYAKALKGTLDPASAQAGWLGLAHNLQWSGDAAGASRAYRRYLEGDASDRLVSLEYIQVLRYRGAYAEAEMLCGRLLEANPNDTEALSLRSEILFWAGNRAFQARRDAEAARTMAPELASAKVSYAAALETLGMHREASEELSGGPTSDMARFIETRIGEETRMKGEAPYSVYNDSDGIHDAIYESLVNISVRGDHRLEARVGEYTSSAPEGSLFSEGRTRASVREFAIGGSALISPGMHFSLSGGGAFADGGSPPGAGIRPIYRTSLEGTPRDRWTVAVSSERQFLKVTPRAIDQAIRYDDVSAGVRRQLGARGWASLEIGHRGWSDGNHSQHADLTGSRTLLYNRKFNLDAGPSASFQAYARDMTAVSGFFTPDRYSRYDSFMAAHGEAGRTFTWELRAEGGAQQITSFSDFSPEWGVRARCSLGMGRVLRLFGSYERKNYSLLARGGWYQGFYVSLAVRPQRQ
jgi:hypothetical protein